MISNLNDTLNLLRKFTWPRLMNAGKILSSYYLSKWSDKPFLWGMPISISVEPTTSCNLRCPECPSGLRSFTRPTGMMEFSFFRKTIDEISKETLYMIFYFQGEPYLNTDFLNMVKHASSKGIYTATSTNGHYLNDENAKKTVESGLDRLIISVDGTTQEVYEQYRVGGKLEKVLEGTRNVVQWKKKLNSSTPHIIFQMLVVKPNEHQVTELQSMALEAGANATGYKTAQVYNYENGNELIPENEKFSRYRMGNNGKYEIKNKLLNHCWRLWHSCVITWDGNVVPCCFDKDASHTMGGIQSNSLRSVWNNPQYQAFRKSVLKSRSEIDICVNCTEGTQVWA
jgi:radical SAM protein with 4Fe4S-binding SPASM domain